MVDKLSLHEKPNLLLDPLSPKPRKKMSRRNIIIYGTLLLVSIYYLLHLHVMVVISLKGMPEIRLRNIFFPLYKYF